MTYTYTTFGSGAFLTGPVAINASGQIVGHYGVIIIRVNGFGFLDSGGAFTTIDVPGSGATFAEAINDSGQIVGYYLDNSGLGAVNASGLEHGFLDSGGTITTIDVPGSTQTGAFAINASGQIVGFYQDSSGHTHGFLDSGGIFMTIDVPGSTSTAASAINASGQIAGYYQDSSGQTQGFLYSGGTITTINPPGSINLGTNAINASGQIVGYYYDSNGRSHGFLDSGGTITTIDVPGSRDTYAEAINDSGQIVGSEAGTGISGTYGFLATPACYCRGTLITTDHGVIAVEQLAIGDRVLTLGGALRVIKWIGRRSYSGRFALGQTHILPICFKAGSIADDVPRRDLWISPNHAMYLDGMLIEAKDLVNGVSIVQAEKVDKIEYFHIELDSHDVIVAEGALSETYIDDDNRAMFHNAHEYWASHPDAPREPVRYCAPRRDEGYEVEAARRQLDFRAGLRPAIETQKLTLRGCVDNVSSHCIAGWAQTVEYPEAPVCLDICAGGRLIGQVLANRYRKDLQEAGLGSGFHSFVFKPPPGLAFALDAVEVRRSLDGAILPLSEHCKIAIAQRDLAA